MIQKVKCCEKERIGKLESSQAVLVHGRWVIGFKCEEGILDLLNSALVEKNPSLSINDLRIGNV